MTTVLKRSEMMASLSLEGQCSSGSRDVDAADAEGARSLVRTHALPSTYQGLLTVQCTHVQTIHAIQGKNKKEDMNIISVCLCQNMWKCKI